MISGSGSECECRPGDSYPLVGSIDECSADVWAAADCLMTIGTIFVGWLPM